MTRRWIACLAFALAAALLPATARGQDADTGLPAQTIQPGECAVFFWLRSQPHSLLAAINVTRGEGQLWQEGAAHAFAAPVLHEAAIRVGAAMSWTVPDLAVRLDGDITEQRGDEYVLSRAFLRRTLPDGAQEVIPLVGLAGCSAGAEP